ncbi:NAD(P)H-binding protein [Hymenobacter sp. AT01-02]|uniref:NAD(P)H-binding protein n=1 Tax=Hymenobacter sp. AT01-02 TaxID=1571877 RepID=UPI000698DFDC|nr:NAD(P)H-binding protein [Hymenobacter sp. AT01-02]
MTDPTSSFLPTVAVLGCGWLGLPLARALVAAGYSVHGSTTTPGQLLTLRHAGILPYLLRLSPTLSTIDADTLHALLHEVDILVLNVPPSRGAGSADAYPTVVQMVAKAAARAQVQHVLYVSSTGVYPDRPGSLRESDAVASSEAVTPLLRAEALFANSENTIVRLAGLMGPGRAPGRFLAGRQDVAQGDAPVNLIHLDDCVGLLMQIIEQEVWGHTFNACANSHPLRRDFYPLAATHLAFSPLRFRPVRPVASK